MESSIARITKRLKLFPPLFDVVKKLARTLAYTDPVYSVLLDYFAQTPQGFFVQIGANDGISHDPIREFIIRNQNWKGVLIEPIPDLLSKCQFSYKYYNHRTRFQFINAAISDRSGLLELWKITDSELSNFPLFASGLVSNNFSHFTKHFPQIRPEQLESVKVKCLTFNELTSQLHLSNIDLLCIDIEGHESVIIPSVLTSEIKPRAILFETDHLSPADLLEIKDLLQKSGYQLSMFPKDCFALRS